MDILIAAAVGAVAFMYASVGHGGASGYLAVMTLLSLPPALMKPGALALNLLVAGAAAVQFRRAGHFPTNKLWPFAATSIPLSYIGASLKVPPALYGPALGVVLLAAGLRLALPDGRGGPRAAARPLPPLPATLALGGGIGFLSGMAGVGGGIFLSPLFILLGWAGPKETADLSAVFIWLNSAAGLWGHFGRGADWPPALWVWVPAAALGGFAGSYFGARRWSGLVLRRLLAAVLVAAAFKAILAAFS
ncbi:MAG: sulfite exporter TauE/SafE family protein [Elusimicrobiota bacterium]